MQPPASGDFHRIGQHFPQPAARSHGVTYSTYLATASPSQQLGPGKPGHQPQLLLVLGTSNPFLRARPSGFAAFYGESSEPRRCSPGSLDFSSSILTLAFKSQAFGAWRPALLNISHLILTQGICSHVGSFSLRPTIRARAYKAAFRDPALLSVLHRLQLHNDHH